MIALGVILWIIGWSIFAYFIFRFGYNLGWQERHVSMILPRRILERVNKDLDDQETHHRHSAMDPKKAIWH